MCKTLLEPAGREETGLSWTRKTLPLKLHIINHSSRDFWTRRPSCLPSYKRAGEENDSSSIIKRVGNETRGKAKELIVTGHWVPVWVIGTMKDDTRRRIRQWDRKTRCRRNRHTWGFVQLYKPKLRIQTDFHRPYLAGTEIDRTNLATVILFEDDGEKQKNNIMAWQIN